MKFGINDLRRVKKIGYKNYYIKRHAYYECFEEAENDLKRIYELMKYTTSSKKNLNKYKDVSFILVLSTTEGKSAIRIKIPTKGRPRYKVIGKKVKPHIHIACFGEKAPSFAEEIVTKLNKNQYKNLEDYYKRPYKSKRLYTIDKLEYGDKGAQYIPYLYNQADKILTYGDMEFEKMYDDFFIVED